MSDLGKFKVWCHNRNQWEEDKVFLDYFGVIYQVGRNGRLQSLSSKTHTLYRWTGIKDCPGS